MSIESATISEQPVSQSLLLTKCLLCDFESNDSICLTDHIMIFHDQLFADNYFCHRCDTGFISAEELNVHLETCNGGSDDSKSETSEEEKKDDSLPNYTSGTPTATPPGATPPVGAQPDGVGASKPAGQPQETQGRSDLTTVSQSDATDYASIRDRIAGKLAPQQFKANPGAHFQSYGEDMDVMFSGEELSEDFKQKFTKY